MQVARPWDMRLVEWMQRSARHEDRGLRRGPIRRIEVVQACAAAVVLGAYGYVADVGVWLVIPGLIVGLGSRLWGRRPGA